MKKFTAGSLALSLMLSSIPLAWAAPSSLSTVDRGQAEAKDGKGQWSKTSQLPVGSWVRAKNGDATFSVPGGKLRLAKGAAVRINKINTKTGDVAFDVQGGRLYVRMDSAKSAHVRVKDKTVVASRGEFVIDDSKADSLYTVSGDAHVEGSEVHSTSPLMSWSTETSTVAADLDGPDVRTRKKDKGGYVESQDTTGTRAGESTPPETTTTAPPVETAPPPVTTPPPVEYVPPPTTTPPPTTAAPVGAAGVAAGGGAFPFLAVLGGIAAAGGIGYLISDNIGSDNTNNAVFFASP